MGRFGLGLEAGPAPAGLPCRARVGLCLRPRSSGCASGRKVARPWAGGSPRGGDFPGGLALLWPTPVAGPPGWFSSSLKGLPRLSGAGLFVEADGHDSGGLAGMRKRCPSLGEVGDFPPAKARLGGPARSSDRCGDSELVLDLGGGAVLEGEAGEPGGVGDFGDSGSGSGDTGGGPGAAGGELGGPADGPAARLTQPPGLGSVRRSPRLARCAMVPATARASARKEFLRE